MDGSATLLRLWIPKWGTGSGRSEQNTSYSHWLESQDQEEGRQSSVGEDFSLDLSVLKSHDRVAGMAQSV